MNFSRCLIVAIFSFSVLTFFTPANAQEQNDNAFKKGISAVKGLFKKSDGDNSVSKKNEEAQDDAKKTAGSAAKDYTVEQLYDLSLDENLQVPKIGQSQRKTIKAYQLVQAKKMAAAGIGVETMRSGEVIIATIESDHLFFPNDTVLKPNAGKYLRPFLPYVKTPDMYRMLLAMHSDDTGTEAYTDALTSGRVLSVLEWFQQNAADSDYIIPYAMGASEPLFLNNSIANRAKNRRLEIYLVPGKTMIEMSRKGTLSY